MGHFHYLLHGAEAVAFIYDMLYKFGFVVFVFVIVIMFSKTRLAEAPTGASEDGQPQPASDDQQQSLQGPSTSVAHGGGPASAEHKSPEGAGHPQVSQKRQRSAGGTPHGGQAKRPKQTGQLSYARAAQEGIQVAIVCEDNPRGQISRDNFADIKRAIGRLVDGLAEEGFTPRLVDSYWAMGSAIMV